MAVDNLELLEVEARSTAQLCESPDSYNVWWRAFSTSHPDHFYTTSAAEMSNAVAKYGYTFEGDPALLFTTQLEFTVPLYRLWSLSATDQLLGSPGRLRCTVRLACTSSSFDGNLHIRHLAGFEFQPTSQFCQDLGNRDVL